MIEIEDGYSESWAELTTEFYYADDPSYVDIVASASSTVPAVVRQQPETETRNRNTRYQGAAVSEFENEYPPLTESARVKQRERDFDVRSRLNRNSREYHHGDNGTWRRDRRRGGYLDNIPRYRDHSRESYHDGSPGSTRPYSYKPRNTHRPAETSPFRSPLSRAKRDLQDLDNSNNFRFTNHRRGGGSSNRSNHNNRYFPVRDEKTKSCRKLHLPSQNDDDHKDKTAKRFQVVTEEDKVKLARREKDIAYGKNTEDYDKYLEVVPRDRRRFNRKIHPRTPDKYVNCSRRSWDAQVKAWKLSLHAWAAHYKDASSRGDCSQKSSYSEGTTETSECTSDKEQERSLEIDDSFELCEGEVGDTEQDECLITAEDNDESNGQEEENLEDAEEAVKEENLEEGEENQEEAEEENQGEDDAFLESLDYSLLVGNEED